MITPLSADLTIDKVSVGRIMKTFTSSKTSAFIAGTTGESASIPQEEKKKLLEYAVENCSEDTKVYISISGNALRDVIEEGKLYADMGADAVVATLPFFYPVSDYQVIRFFEQIADQVQCPLILYNHPGLVGRSIPLELAEILSHHPNIAGLKDSERNDDRLDSSITRWKNREDFSFLVGWAARSAEALAKGADGIVPSTGNLVPKLYQDLYIAAISGDNNTAGQLQERTDRIGKVYQENRNISESIPALKLILSLYMLCQPYVLPPMEMPGPEEQESIKKHINEIISNLE